MFQVAIDGNDIEPTGKFSSIRVTLQVIPGAGRYPRLLAGIHRFSATPERLPAAMTDLDEDQVFTFSHDQVDFSAAAAEIALDGN